uniref:Uncharacterized protein n=1 Tax=Octopus bimaculoides TaxID=37653 RepID=A0A0L8IGY7_OCTBM
MHEMKSTIKKLCSERMFESSLTLAAMDTGNVTTSSDGIPATDSTRKLLHVAET